MKSLLEKFVDMCSLLEAGDDKFFFPFDTVEHSLEYDTLSSDKDYPMLKEKMMNLVCLINSDNSLINKDIETELWNMI